MSVPTPDYDNVMPDINANTAQRVSASVNSRRTTQRNVYQQVMNTLGDFEGVTPRISGILALRSESIVTKINYDCFYEKLGVYIMNEFKNRKNVVEVTKTPPEDVIKNFEANSKPTELTNEKKKSSVETEIKKEEIEEYVKDLETMNSNLKNLKFSIRKLHR